ncbi:MAG: hypothetical protein KGS60_06585 [Verrucomicrobia bacterium]|nr:hypothetical protein [Verrucomicrobiota bacterium]
MKRVNPLRFTAILILAAGVLLPGGLRADVKQDYQQAKAAESEGDYAKAIAIYQTLVARFPQDPRLKASLAQARLAAREGNAKVTLESKLKTIIIPQVEFMDADLDSVFAYLIEKTKEISGGKVSPNFIYKGSSEESKRVRINLALANIPVTELIRYVGEISSTSFVYEPYAIVGSPLQKGAGQSDGGLPR